MRALAPEKWWRAVLSGMADHPINCIDERLPRGIGSRMLSVPRRLKLLEKSRASAPVEREAMLVSELDGFLAGVLSWSLPT